VAERSRRLSRAAALGALLMAAAPAGAAELMLEKPAGTIRVATFNTDMNRKGAGVLIDDIAKRDGQVLNVAEIILRVRPDIVLINEIDHDPDGIALGRFVALLADGVGGVPGLDYPHHFIAPVNTGIPSGFDLDGDGAIMGARDALGYGRFPGQYGMAILSRFPLGPARTFQHQRWAAIPWAVAPVDPNGTPYYSAEAWAALPVSSKSHWDVIASLPDGRGVHLLASHPTPPVFDGPEDRNGLRNAAEIRFWADYLSGAGWMTDDAGASRGLAQDALFVVLGDLNADPLKGDGDRAAIGALLAHPRIRDVRPAMVGGGTNTANWPVEDGGPGDLRVDYALPAAALDVAGSGVFWPAPGTPLHRLVRVDGRDRVSSDHRLVWLDIALER